MKYPVWFLDSNGVAPLAEIGESEPTQIYVRVGAICTRWEQIDGNLTEIFSIILARLNMGTVNLASAIELLASHGSVSGRINLIKNQVDVAFSLDPEKRANARAIFSKIKKVSALRNNAVHGQVRKNLNMRSANQFVLQSSKYKMIKPVITQKNLGDGSWMNFEPLKFQYNSETLDGIIQCLEAVACEIDSWTNEFS